jgi:hypothetical protein
MDLPIGVSSWRQPRNTWCHFEHRRGQHQCAQTQTDLAKETTAQGNLSNMASSWCKISPIIPIFVLYLLVFSLVCPVHSLETSEDRASNQTFRPEEEFKKMKIIQARLNKINKPAIKTIQVFHFVSN